MTRRSQAARFAAALAFSMFPAIAPARSGDAKLDPAHYREIPFAEIGRPPIGAPVSSGPVIGLREDQVRAKAKYTGQVRESTKADTRLRDTWMLSKRLAKPGVKSTLFEFEFTDGSRRQWLPAIVFILPVLMEARPDDEFELYVHRFDAPHAGAELAGSEAVILEAIPIRKKPIATAQPVFSEGGLLFTYRRTPLGIGVKRGGASNVSEGKTPGEPASFLLEFENPDRSTARIEVAGIRGPGVYMPQAIAIELPPGGSLGGPNVVDVRGCKVRVKTINPNKVEGTLECPAGELRPADAKFTAAAR